MKHQTFTLQELELIKQQKQKQGRFELDKLYNLYVENKLASFEISKIKNGYQLKSEKITYLIEHTNSSLNSSTLTIIGENQPNKSYINYEIAEERYKNGSLKVSLDEFFVFLHDLTF